MTKKDLFKAVFIFVFSFTVLLSEAQTKRVLFLGNSYTAFHNLPQLTADVAASMGDSIYFESNTPGGYTLEGHTTNVNSLAKIAQGNWDFVILQEQSQRPSFPLWQVEQDVFPYAEILDSLVTESNPCAEVVFYMTWGRQNGDASNCASWPPVCTYAGMDSLLNLRYRMMADMNDAIVSPVGAVWNYVRENYPNIQLYNPDESHPSTKGSFLAACCHYISMFRKDPTLIPFNSILTANEAMNIKEACKIVLYDDLLEWYIGEFDLTASFDFVNSFAYTYEFTNTSSNNDGQVWNILGETYSNNIAIISFPDSGDYVIDLQIFNECDTLTLTQTINIPEATNIQELNQELNFVYPNPTSNELFIDIRNIHDFGVTIYDLNGRMVFRKEQIPNGFLDVSSLGIGTYLFELKSEIEVHSQIIVIER